MFLLLCLHPNIYSVGVIFLWMKMFVRIHSGSPFLLFCKTTGRFDYLKAKKLMHMFKHSSF